MPIKNTTGDSETRWQAWLCLSVGHRVGMVECRGTKRALRVGRLARLKWLGVHGHILFAIAACGNLSAALAQDWRIETVLREEFQYDDNTRLLTDGSEPIWGLVSTPELRLSSRSPTFDVDVGVVLDINKFSGTGTSEEGARDRDSFDQHLDTNLDHKLERHTLGITGGYDRETARTSELTDTGRVESDATKESLLISGRWSYQASQADTVQTSAFFGDTAYDTDDLNDFRTGGLSALWSHQADMMNTFEAVASASRFETRSGTDVTSDLASFETNWEHIFSERLKTRIGVGLRYVTTDTTVNIGGSSVTSSRSSLGPLGSAGLSYVASEQTTVDLKFSTTVDPSGFGEFRQNDRLGASLQHRISPNLRADISASAFRQSSADDGSDNETRYVSFRAGLRWHFVRNLFLSGSYRFRTLDRTDGKGWARSNALLFSVTYAPPVW